MIPRSSGSAVSKALVKCCDTVPLLPSTHMFVPTILTANEKAGYDSVPLDSTVVINGLHPPTIDGTFLSHDVGLTVVPIVTTAPDSEPHCKGRNPDPRESR